MRIVNDGNYWAAGPASSRTGIWSSSERGQLSSQDRKPTPSTSRFFGRSPSRSRNTPKLLVVEVFRTRTDFRNRWPHQSRRNSRDPKPTTNDGFADKMSATSQGISQYTDHRSNVSMTPLTMGKANSHQTLGRVVSQVTRYYAALFYRSFSQ